jgi:hypothetical protein
VKQLSIVCGVWTLGFAIKLLAVAFGRTLFYIENQKVGATNYGTACLLGFCDFLTIVVPIYCVVEDSFVKLMPGTFLKYVNGVVPYDDDEEESPPTLTTNFDLRQTDSLKEQLSIPLLNSSGQVGHDTFTAMKIQKSESVPLVTIASLDQRGYDLVIRTTPIVQRKLDPMRQQLEAYLTVSENQLTLLNPLIEEQPSKGTD